MRKFQHIVSAALCSSVLIPTMAFAQEAATPEKDEPIVVTATLRTLNVQDIPLAVTAVSPTQLERQGVADVKSLASISPSFNIQSSQTESGGTSIKVRGVGTTGNNAGLESSVGIFIDGVYQSRPGIALGELVDLERLEILRGPQGTLFGRNTSAGALNVTTKKANISKFEGFANASYGNYNLVSVQGGINVPIAKDIAALRITAAYRNRDGFLKSSTGATSNNKNRYIIRGQLYIEPTPDLSIRLIADYSKSKELCCDAVIVRETELQPFFAGPVGAFPGHGLTSDGVDQFGPSALNNLSTNGQQFRDGNNQWGFSGEIKLDLGAAKFTYIGSYRDYDSESTQETDFTSLNSFTVGRNGQASRPGIEPTGQGNRNASHEVRLQGTAFTDKLDWLIGAYYGDEKINTVGSTTLGADYQRAVSAGNFAGAAGVNPLFTLTALGNGAGGPINSTGSFGVNHIDQKGRSFSVFTHNVLSLTDKLSITLGARYVDEKKSAVFDQVSASNPACQASVNGVLSGAVPGALRAGLVGLNCFYLVAPVNLTAPAALGGGLASRLLPLPREWTGDFKDDALTYTAQVSYKPTDSSLVYAGFSHGFKSGGFNLDPTAANLLNSGAILAGLAATPTAIIAPQYANPAFKSEKVDQIEVGIKAQFGRIKTNIAFFDMKMKDFQVLEFTGTQFLTFNVDNARSTGVEFEAFGRLSDHISGNFSATYANSRYGDDCNVNVAPEALASITRLCGSTLTNAPKIAGVIGLTYDGPINSSGWGLVVNGNLNYSDRRRTSTIPLDTNNTPIPFDYQEAYFKMNARIGITTPDQKMTFELWGTNLNNEITRGITANTPLRGGAGTRSRIGFVEEPRMYGLTVRAKF
jgi:iron complex outermembrane recepter protein